MWRHLMPNFQHFYENSCDTWNLCPDNQVFSYQCNVKAHGDRTTNNQQPLMFFLFINSLIREERMWKGTSQKTHLICHHISHHLTLTYSSHYFVLTTVFRRLLIWLMPNLGLTRITVSTLESWRNSNNFLIVSRFYIITLLQGSQFESWNPNLHYFYEK